MSKETTLTNCMLQDVFNCPADQIDEIFVQRPGMLGGGQSYGMWTLDWDVERRVWPTANGFMISIDDLEVNGESIGPFLSIDECMDAYIAFKLEEKS